MIVTSGKEELHTEIDGSIREKVWSTDDGGIIPSPLILMVSDRITQRSTQLGGEDKIHINTDRQRHYYCTRSLLGKDEVKWR